MSTKKTAFVLLFAAATAQAQSVSVSGGNVEVRDETPPSKLKQARETANMPPLSAPVAPQEEAGGVVHEFVYHPRAVYQIRAKAGMFTNIEVPADEKIQGFYLSDTVFWKFAVAKDGSRVFVRPSEEGRINAGTLVTDKRVYELVFKAYPASEKHWHKRVQWEFEPDVFPAYGVFADPADAQAWAASEPVGERRAETDNRKGEGKRDWLVNVEKANFNYRVVKSETFAPIIVFDDGVFTYMRFPKLQDMPAIFAFDRSPEQFRLVDYVVRDGHVIVHRVVEGGFLLKLGDRTAIVERF